MRRSLKVATSIIIWFLWCIFFFALSNLNFTDILQTAPNTYNPFIMLKWVLWDNALLNGISLMWIIAASCVTYVYTKVFDALWEENSKEELNE